MLFFSKVAVPLRESSQSALLNASKGRSEIPEPHRHLEKQVNTKIGLR